MFWKNAKPYFRDKSSNSTNITLVEKDMTITDENKFPILLMSILLALQKKREKFKTYYLVKRIKEIYFKIKKWYNIANIITEIQKLNVKKWSTFGCIPVTILKDCVDAYLVHLTYSGNHSLQASLFSQKLKQGEVILLYKN